MDDLIWVDPESNGAVGNCWHNASSVPQEGFVLYARVDTLADAERKRGENRKLQSDMIHGD